MQKSSQTASKSNSIKLHAFLAQAGVASRRKAEVMIGEGRIKVNNQVAHVGQRITVGKDTVAIDGTPLSAPTTHRYFLVHKPKGVVSTTHDELNRHTVLSLLPKEILAETGRLYPVGRLDMESEGLLLLTNDGDVTQRYTHPKFEVNKTYDVLLDRQPTEKALQHLERGVRLKDGLAQVDAVEPVGDFYNSDKAWFRLTIHEGRNRLIRRLWERLGYEVERLIRVSLGEYTLDQLHGKQWLEVAAPKL